MNDDLNKLVRRSTAISDVEEGVLIQVVDLDMTSTDGSKKVERWQQYGFTSRPVSGAHALVISVKGHRFVVALDHLKDRPKDLAPAEVAVWHKNGDRIHFKDNNEIHAKTNLFKVIGKLEVTEESHLAKEVTTDVDFVSPNVTQETHYHTGDDGGTTSEPIG